MEERGDKHGPEKGKKNIKTRAETAYQDHHDDVEAFFSGKDSLEKSGLTKSLAIITIITSVTNEDTILILI